MSKHDLSTYYSILPLLACNISDSLLQHLFLISPIISTMSKRKIFAKSNKDNISLNPPDLSLIGQTFVSDKFPITMDNFWFAINSKVVVNPFDFVTVKNLHNTRTIGIVKELQTVALNGSIKIRDNFAQGYKKSIEK